MESKITPLPELINIMFPPDILDYPLAQGCMRPHPPLKFNAAESDNVSPWYQVPDR